LSIYKKIEIDVAEARPSKQISKIVVLLTRLVKDATAQSSVELLQINDKL
jgi:hypothetical protein